MRFGNSRDGFDRGPQDITNVTCSDCVCHTQVPFKPDGSRPVYRQECYQENRPSR
ncbi:MAG: hypothetical protein NTV25_03585 [Methanothrix sp.]|nr:hypothetical protein [Methanothrix sp.]